LAALLLVLVGAALGYLLLGPTRRSATATVPASPTALAAPSASTHNGNQPLPGATNAGASASVAVATATAAASSAPSLRAVDKDMLECIAPIFPPATFVSGRSSFDWACKQPNPARGAATLHTSVVTSRGSAGVSEAMREWSTLGWYSIAVFVIVRERCCDRPVDLMSSPTEQNCKFNDAVTQLARTGLGGDDVAVEEALRNYHRSVGCLTREGAAHQYAQGSYPRPSELSTFERTLERLKALRTP
jgi:hypothetical protein